MDWHFVQTPADLIIISTLLFVVHKNEHFVLNIAGSFISQHLAPSNSGCTRITHTNLLRQGIGSNVADNVHFAQLRPAYARDNDRLVEVLNTNLFNETNR